MRTMYDGIAADAATIAKFKPEMVAGYIDGDYKWSTAEFNLMGNAVKVRIAVKSSTNDGDVIDCENGDATPAEAAAWVSMRKKAGYYRPTIYCNKSAIDSVREATGKLVLGTDYDIYCADWTGKAHEVTSAITGGKTVTIPVVQYASTAKYDISAVYDSNWPYRTKPVVQSAKSATSGTQEWYCCNKCAAMVCNAKYPCVAGGNHDISGSWTYKIPWTK